MSRRSQNIGSAISATVIGSVFFLAALQIKVDQVYSDFIVGSLAWYAGGKFQDLFAWPVFILATFLSYLALSEISSKLELNSEEGVSERFTSQLMYWSLPFYAGTASLFLGGALDIKTAMISALGLISLCVIGFFKRNNSTKKDPEIWSVLLLGFFLISLIPIQLAVVLSRAPVGLVGDLNVRVFVSLGNFLVITGFATGVFVCVKFHNYVAKYLPKIILLAQIGLPFFLLTLYPSRIMQPTGEIIKYETTIYLKLLIITAVLFGVFDVVSRFKRYACSEDVMKCFSPFAIFSLVVALKVGHTVAPYISPDDYHFGEHLLGWWSYIKGFVPYVDYIPAHGLLENDFRSFLSFIFYDATASSIGEAGRLAFAILGFIAFVSFYYFTGSLVLAFSVILLLGGRLTWFFFVPFICLWLSPKLIAQPSKWLSVWIVSAPFVILSVPPQGLILVASFGLLAVKIAWDIIQIGDKKSWLHLGVIAIITTLAFVATPLLSMLIGAIRYVLENGSINQIAYGIPWSLSWGAGVKSGFVFEAIRMSWVLIPLLCLHIIYKNWRNFSDSKSIFYPALIFFIFLLLLIPYSMGRIDPGAVSRPGLVSIFGWAILFPLLVWKYVNAKARAFVVIASVFASALLGFGVTSFSGLSSIASQKIHSPQLRDSIASGLPNVGRAFMDESQWNRINRLNKLLKLRLASNETYLDLTSRNAHYFYLNRLPAMPVTAPYNMAHPAQQMRAVEVLKTSPPKLALLQAENIVHDGGGLALRNPYLYRFVLDSYIPRMESGFILGYLKSEVKNSKVNEITAEIKPITDENWVQGFGRHSPAIVLSDPILATMIKAGDQIRFKNGELRTVQKIKESVIWLEGERVLIPDVSSVNFVDVLVSPGVYQEYSASLFHRAFAVSDLKKLPISWGKSEKSLREKMNSPVGLSGLSPSLFNASSLGDSYKVEGDDPQLIFNTSALGISGQSSGLLRFEFKCIGRTSEPRIQVFWWGDERSGPFEESSVKFTAYNGALIVPLDASPWWVGLRKINGIRIDLDNASACRAFSVENIYLYRRSWQGRVGEL